MWLLLKYLFGRSPESDNFLAGHKHSPPPPPAPCPDWLLGCHSALGRRPFPAAAGELEGGPSSFGPRRDGSGRRAGPKGGHPGLRLCWTLGQAGPQAVFPECVHLEDFCCRVSPLSRCGPVRMWLLGLGGLWGERGALTRALSHASTCPRLHTSTSKLCPFAIPVAPFCGAQSPTQSRRSVSCY